MDLEIKVWRPLEGQEMVYGVGENEIYSYKIIDKVKLKN
jgi:hypothetical protein